MRDCPPNQFRLTADLCQRKGFNPEIASTDDCGMNGMFIIPCGKDMLRCMCSDGEGWEHVSVSLRHRCPTWDEMCFVKGMFFNDEEVVMQLHPKRSEYVNYHPFCLHLWRPTVGQIITPPPIFVGPLTSAGNR